MSIRQRLLRSLLLGMVAIASITGVLIYRHVRSELDELYNAHLQHAAMFMAREFAHIDYFALATTPKNNPIDKVWEEEDYLIQFWRHDGVLLSQETPALTDVQIPLYAAPGFFHKHIKGESWRIYRADSTHFIVQIAQPEFARHQTITETSLQLLIPLLLQVPLLILAGWLSVRHGLKPLEAVSHAIAQRQPDALSAISVDDQPSELRPLIERLNELLLRLDAALQQQKHFIADAAHELRTPVATLQLQLDLLQRATSDEERSHTFAQLQIGLQRATHLTQQLLAIARAETTPQETQRNVIDLKTTIKTSIQRYLPLARARDIDLGVTQLVSAAIPCLAADIETVIDNLISNAIRYTPRGGRVDVAVYVETVHAVIEVADSGPGIPVAERRRIFDRFYRVLHSSDIVEGSGLGLAIVKTICDRYGATIHIGAGIRGAGAGFTVRWPRVHE